MNFMRGFRKFFSSAMTFIALMVLITAAICLVLQFKPAIVVSGSMEPTIETGSFLLIDKKDKDIKVGDIIAYTVQDMQVSHRVVDITEQGYITKGDNNDNVDFAPVKPENVIGTALFSVPKVGYFFNWVTSVQGIIIVATLCIAFLLTGALASNKDK